MRTAIRQSTHLTISDDPKGVLSDAVTRLVQLVGPVARERSLAPDGPGWSLPIVSIARIEDGEDFLKGAEAEVEGVRWLGEGRDVWEVTSDVADPSDAVVLTGDELRALVRDAAALLAAPGAGG